MEYLERLNRETISEVNKTLSSISAAIRTWRKVKTKEQENKIKRLMTAHKLLSKWKEKASKAKTKTELYLFLKEFTQICERLEINGRGNN